MIMKGWLACLPFYHTHIFMCPKKQTDIKLRYTMKDGEEYDKILIRILIIIVQFETLGDIMSDNIELLTIKDVMELLHISRKMATRLLNRKGCPILPRKKGQHYYVLKDEFIEWIKFAAYKGKW